LFDAAWHDDGKEHHERLVARIAPDRGDVPVFATYDLERQFRLIRLVGDLTAVPVPRTFWSEADPAAIGAPFFVMARVDGVVPPDVLPYNFGDNWLHDATPTQQRTLQDSTVGVLADLHSIDDPAERFGFLAFEEGSASGDSALRRHVAHTRAWYEYVAADGGRSELVERAFAWLDDHWPSAEGDAVVSWGDSRIGNVLYRDFEPVGVLDWEMAGLGPRELDVAWLVNAHRTFEDIAASMELPGMPHFLRWDDVASTYERRTGHELRDLAFYGTYAAVQWSIVFLRTGRRQVHFGERQQPGDVDELIMNRPAVEQMLAGTYWANP
jgi:aminoglycoside phosphotransferase (APT) family kinase protein